MRYVIDDELCKKAHLELPLLLTILLLNTGTKYNDNLKTLLDRDIIRRDPEMYGRYLITSKWANKVSEILLDSEQQKPSSYDLRLENLARQLISIFPEGKKEGTTMYWRGNVKEIKLKLKKFFKMYGNKYTDEQVIEAATTYVNSFNGNYGFMRILKYFIYKSVHKIDEEGNGFIEEVSDLATLIENPNAMSDANGNWQNSVR